MRSAGQVVHRRTAAVNVTAAGAGGFSGGTSSPRPSSPPTGCFTTTCGAASGVEPRPPVPPPPLAYATSSSLSSISSSCISSICFDHHHHQQRRKKRRQHHPYRNTVGSYYYTVFGGGGFTSDNGDDNNNACFHYMRKYRIVGQWTAVFVVIYLATLLMTNSSGYYYSTTNPYQQQYHRSTQNSASSSSYSTYSSTTMSSLTHHHQKNNNNIAFPTSLMIHNGQNYHIKQRSHHRRYHHHGNTGSNRNLRNQNDSYDYYNNGSIRPLPPLLQPHQRDDDYTTPNFGDLDLYMLGDEDSSAEDDGYDKEEGVEEHGKKNRVATTTATTGEPILWRREILEDERLDPDRFQHEFRRDGRPRPHYDDHYYHNDQYIDEKEKYPENEYYWYYAMDDDVERNPYNGWEDDTIQNERHCRRVAFHREIQINCNNFHEFDFQGLVTKGESSYVGGGAFRHVFKAAKSHVDDEFIFKEAAYTKDHKFDFMDMEAMRMDGVIATAIQPHPLFVDTYGFCALSQFSELMHQGDVEQISVPYYERCDKKFQLNDEDDVEPWNDLEPSTKLQWALQMAEAVAVLNNFKDGVIVHDDIQPPQFLPTKDGRLKFNDFNRAEVMLFDEENQEYCRYRNDVGPADWRAPQEYLDEPLNEAIDVWSLCNNFYSLLTGLMPFYEECNYEIIQQRIIHHETAYIDPRWRNHSVAEGLLVDILEKCWVYDPDERIEIGQLVLLLRQAVAENEKHEAALQQQQTAQQSK